MMLFLRFLAIYRELDYNQKVNNEICIQTMDCMQLICSKALWLLFRRASERAPKGFGATPSHNTF